MPDRTSLPSSALPSLSVYVHWPFCRTICPYCDFNVYGARAIDETAWADAFKAELKHVFQWRQQGEVQSIFFGGGTPSLMPPRLIGEVLAQIDALWGIAADAEISLEANPVCAPQTLFKQLAAVGITRLSLGAQSLDDAALAYLGRTHKAADVRASFAAAQEIFAHASLDVIYARPTQQVQHWQRELAAILALQPDHLSAYQLTIERGTRFYKDYQAGAFALPDEDLAAALYQCTQAMCADAGLPIYEVSNYARAGSPPHPKNPMNPKNPTHKCRHNLLIWQGGDYIGIGPGAHGRITRADGKTRLATYAIARPQNWLQHIATHGSGLAEATPLSPTAQGEERLMLGLRLVRGVALADLAAHDIHIPADKIASLQAQGLLRADPDRLAATADGRLVLDRLIGALII